MAGKSVSVGPRISHEAFPCTPGRYASFFEDEYASFARGAGLGLAEPSTVASPIYTLLGRCAVVCERTGARKWEYRGRYFNGSESKLVTEAKALNSFTPLQLDCFIQCGSFTKEPHLGPDHLLFFHGKNATRLIRNEHYVKYR